MMQTLWRDRKSCVRIEVQVFFEATQDPCLLLGITRRFTRGQFPAVSPQWGRARNVTYVSGMDPSKMVGPAGLEPATKGL